jgi:hypothetical protein
MTRRAIFSIIFSMFHSPFLSTSVKKEEERRIYSPEESSELELFAESEGRVVEAERAVSARSA